MDRSNVIYLIAYNQTQDTFGVWQKTMDKTKVFCDVMSVSQAEWYEGSRNGLNPQFRFTVFRYDYNGEQAIEYNGKTYSIYRTYVGRNETIDLYAELKKGVPLEDTPTPPDPTPDPTPSDPTDPTDPSQETFS